MKAGNKLFAKISFIMLGILAFNMLVIKSANADGTPGHGADIRQIVIEELGEIGDTVILGIIQVEVEHRIVTKFQWIAGPNGPIRGVAEYPKPNRLYMDPANQYADECPDEENFGYWAFGDPLCYDGDPGDDVFFFLNFLDMTWNTGYEDSSNGSFRIDIIDTDYIEEPTPTEEESSNETPSATEPEETNGGTTPVGNPIDEDTKPQAQEEPTQNVAPSSVDGQESSRDPVSEQTTDTQKPESAEEGQVEPVEEEQPVAQQDVPELTEEPETAYLSATGGGSASLWFIMMPLLFRVVFSTKRSD